MNVRALLLGIGILGLSSLLHGMNGFRPEFIKENIDNYVTTKSDCYLRDIDVFFNTINPDISKRDLAQQGYYLLFTAIMELFQDKSSFKAKELCPKIDGIFTMMLRFCYAQKYNQNLDNLDCKSFIKKMDEYVNCKKRKQTVLLNEENLSYVLPIMSFFNQSGVAITELSLAGRNLSKFPTEIFHLFHLKRLYLNDNKLQHIPDEIYELSHLEELDISNNQIKGLPEKFVRLFLLKRLSLAFNQLTKLPPYFNALTALQKLDLSDNPDLVMPFCLEDMKNGHQQLEVTF